MEKRDGLSLSWNTNRLLEALALIVFGMLMPMVFTQREFHVYERLFQALERHDTGILLDGASRLIALNTIRSTPHYLGIMMFMEGVNIQWNDRAVHFIKLPGCYLLHIFLYKIIFFIYGIRLDVGMPSLLVFLCIELLNRFSFRLRNKLIIIILFLVTIQGLDILPGITKIGFGNGEISMDIKAMAQVLDGESLLSHFAVLLFFSFAVTALLMGLLDLEQRQVIKAHRKAEQDELQLYQARMKNLEMRSFLEIQNLVHDLKSPLTTIQGLASLTEALVHEPKLAEYQCRIVSASDRMSQMISEILYEDRMSPVSTEQLICLALSCMAANPMVSKIVLDNQCPDCQVRVNSIRMARALVNLLENACKAIDQENGRVSVKITCKGEAIVWKILDNGVGMSPEVLENIWVQGYSGNGSTGLGLSFVNQVVSMHHGTIRAESRKGAFTRIILTLPNDGGGLNAKEHTVY